jgi:uncharacterized protein YjbJ (UPF0337 family)
LETNLTKRSKANVEVAVGAIQEGLGRVIGDEDMEARGAAHQVVGHARDEAAKAAERIRGRVEEIAGIAKNEAGQLLGDRTTEVEGKVKELTGKARQLVNR